MVPMWMFPVAIACGNAFVLKPSERDPGASLLLAELWARGRPARRRVHRGAGRQGGGRRAARPPRRRRRQLRRLDPDRPVRLRAGGAGRQAGAGARRRQEPHGRAARRRPRRRRRRRGERRLRLGGRAVHGDLGRGRRRPDRRRPGRPASPSASAGLVVAPGATPGADMGPLVTDAHRDRVAGLRRRGRGRGRRPGGRRARAGGRRPRRTASSSARACSTTCAPEMSIYRDEIFGPVLSVVRAGVLRRGGARSWPPTRTATASPCSPATAARPAGSRPRSRPAWSASTCRSPCRWRTTRSAAGATRCSATPTPTAPRACTSTPGARWSRPAGPTRTPAGPTSASPPTLTPAATPPAADAPVAFPPCLGVLIRRRPAVIVLLGGVLAATSAACADEAEPRAGECQHRCGRGERGAPRSGAAPGPRPPHGATVERAARHRDDRHRGQRHDHHRPSGRHGDRRLAQPARRPHVPALLRARRSAPTAGQIAPSPRPSTDTSISI